jgi:tRNA (guanine-N(7)-)-methyltransferase
MRQRKIKNLDEKLAALSAYIIDDPASLKGRWSEAFGNDKPIYLEIGCGKGRFITGCATSDPDSNYIGIEGQDSVVLRALEKTEAGKLGNTRFVVQYVNDVREWFAEGELAGVFLNFSDPWPKDRHAKRRLTYYERLQSYCDIISADGSIRFKTDNEGLFEFTLEQIEEAGLTIAEMTRDLHKSEFADANIQTEYEYKFATCLGKNINYVKILPCKS